MAITATDDTPAEITKLANLLFEAYPALNIVCTADSIALTDMGDDFEVEFLLVPVLLGKCKFWDRYNTDRSGDMGSTAEEVFAKMQRERWFDLYCDDEA